MHRPLQGREARLRGLKLKADSAMFILPDELAPSLSSDVVVRGTERAIEPAAGQRVRPDVQIDLDLGRDFTVRGQGLDTRLEGNLTLRSTAASSSATTTSSSRRFLDAFFLAFLSLAIDGRTPSPGEGDPDAS